MAVPGSRDDQSKKDRREVARETARLQREAERKRKRRNRIFIQGGITIGVLAVAAIIALVVVNSVPKPAGPGPLNMRSDGILLSGADMKAVPTAATPAGKNPVATDRDKHKDTVNIVTYIDYQCPFCEQFETTNQDQIAGWVKDGEATLEIHPISFLDTSSQGNRYSTRAANAAACVANYDPDDFYAVNTALYANQPAEQTNGKTDAELISVLSGAGASSSKIADCVKSEKFTSWVTAATNRLHVEPGSTTKVFKGVANTPVVFSGTPTVFVNGVQYPASQTWLTDPNEFASFVAAQAGGDAPAQ